MLKGQFTPKIKNTLFCSSCLLVPLRFWDELPSLEDIIWRGVCVLCNILELNDALLAVLKIQEK